MAVVRVELGRRSQAQRDAIIRGITEVFVLNGFEAEEVQVALREIEMNYWGKGAKTFAQRAAEQGIVLDH